MGTRLVTSKCWGKGICNWKNSRPSRDSTSFGCLNLVQNEYFWRIFWTSLRSQNLMSTGPLYKRIFSSKWEWALRRQNHTKSRRPKMMSERCHNFWREAEAGLGAILLGYWLPFQVTRCPLQQVDEEMSLGRGTSVLHGSCTMSRRYLHPGQALTTPLTPPTRESWDGMAGVYRMSHRQGRASMGYTLSWYNVFLGYRTYFRWQDRLYHKYMRDWRVSNNTSIYKQFFIGQQHK